jgi:hypothetical protein
MRLAWFRPTRPDSDALLDRTALVIAALRRSHAIDVVTAAEAHDFVWQHDRQPYDLFVYEVGDSDAHQFIWPYLLHYPGVACLTETRMSERRAWGNSRLVVVADAAVARSLAFESSAIRVAPLGIQTRSDFPFPALGTAASENQTWSEFPGRLTLGILEPAPRPVVERALERARQRGANVTLVPDALPAGVLAQSDVIVALEWPPTAGPPLAALLAMAAGRPVVVLEVEATAGWPAVNPQNWQPRGFSGEPPIAVSIDPRDEEHSLMLAIVRLAADALLRKALADAGRVWWRGHATIDHAVAAWESILREAVALRPASPQQVANGSERAREILAEMNVTVDFL